MLQTESRMGFLGPLSIDAASAQRPSGWAELAAGAQQHANDCQGNHLMKQKVKRTPYGGQRKKVY